MNRRGSMNASEAFSHVKLSDCDEPRTARGRRTSAAFVPSPSVTQYTDVPSFQYRATSGSSHQASQLLFSPIISESADKKQRLEEDETVVATKQLDLTIDSADTGVTEHFTNTVVIHSHQTAAQLKKHYEEEIAKLKNEKQFESKLFQKQLDAANKKADDLLKEHGAMGHELQQLRQQIIQERQSHAIRVSELTGQLRHSQAECAEHVDTIGKLHQKLEVVKNIKLGAVSSSSDNSSDIHSSSSSSSSASSSSSSSSRRLSSSRRTSYGRTQPTIAEEDEQEE